MSTDDTGSIAQQLEQNRRSWNAVVPVHAAHRQHDAQLLAAGGTTLFADELALLGDVRAKRLLHLLCNGGRDTLSLAVHGAVVTGVDLSDAAIVQAEQLRAASGLPAQFICSDVLQYLRDAAAAAFDVVYAGYGAICWIRDLNAFFAGVQRILVAGGRFVLIEFHPSSNMFDADWQLRHDYPHGGTPLQLDGVGDYVGAAAGALSAGTTNGNGAFVNPEACVLFRWGIGDVVSAAAHSGLIVEQLREYPYVNGERPFTRMKADAQQRLAPPDDIPAIPLMYGLTLCRAANPGVS